MSLLDIYLIVGDIEVNIYVVSVLKILFVGKYLDKNGFCIYIGEKGDKVICKFVW